jgi:hypothetical protein
MNEVRIGPAAQWALVTALLAAVVAVVALQMPEIRRYLKIRQM